jgi:L-threonylcarbamoyladenylate synthase
MATPPEQVAAEHMPPDAASTAHQLFAVLRTLDAQGVNEIWIETPPEDAEWDGVRDRLQRAAAS